MMARINKSETKIESEENAEAGSELHVLKTIILREGYLHRLQNSLKMSKTQATTQMSMNDSSCSSRLEELLDILRIATVEVVESIVVWQKRQLSKNGMQMFHPSPFLWNGFNYLLKIPSDLDFLQLHTTLKFEVGFSLERNPFVIPNALDKLVYATSTEESIHKGVQDRSHDLPQFSTIGGRKKRCESAPNSSSNCTSPRRFSAKKKKGKLQKRKLPYSNVPLTNQSGTDNSHHRVRSVHDTPCKKRDKYNTSQHSVSFILDTDMVRIRAAERVIIAEEALYGCYVRDQNGAIVPAWKERQKEFSSALKIDDFRPLELPAETHQGLAPFAADAGCAHKCPHRPSAEINHLPLDANGKTSGTSSSSAADVKGNTNCRRDDFDKSRLQKYGGELCLPSESGIMIGRKRPPLVPSQQTVIDLVIKRKRTENKMLQKSLTRIQENNEGERHQTISDTASIKAQIDFNEQLIEGKEERLFYLRHIEKEIETRRRARLLETKRRLIKNEELEDSSLEDPFPPQSLEHDSIIAVQKLVRGFQQRGRYRMFRQICELSATLIQSGYRGMVGRKRMSFTRQKYWSSVDIQRNFRGFAARGHFSHRLQYTSQQKSTLVIQKYIRGVWGRRRACRFLKYRMLAGNAAQAVAHRTFGKTDIILLATMIEDHILRGESNTLPNFLLHLIRIVCLLIGSIDTDMSIISYNYLGNGSKVMIDESLTWENAVKILRRSNKLLHYMRLLALGPTQRIPFLFSLTEKSVKVYIAYKKDALFNLESCSNIVKGSKAAYNMMVWVDSLVALFDMQKCFLDDMRTSIPYPLTLMEAYEQRRSLLVKMKILEERHKSTPPPLDYNLDVDMAKLNHDIMLNECKFQNDSENVINILQSRLIKAEKSATVAEDALSAYQEDLDIGLVADIHYRKYLRLDVGEKTFYVCDARLRLEVAKNEHNENIAKIKLYASKPDKPVYTICEDVGKLEAQIVLLKEEKKDRRATIENDELNSEVYNYMDEDLVEITNNLNTSIEKKKHLESHLWKCVSMFEHNLDQKCNSRVCSMILQSLTAETSNEDIEDEEALAQEEMNAVHSQMSRSLLDAKHEYKSSIIMLDNNLPVTFRTELFESLSNDLEGHTVRVIGNKNLGLDPKAYQSIIDTKQVVVANVEVGMTFDARTKFTQGSIVTKSAIDPCPLFICVLGNPLYCGDHSNETANIKSDADQFEAFNCDTKASAKRLSLILSQLSSSTMQYEIKKFGREETQPSNTIVIRAEALVTLLNTTSISTTEEDSGWKYVQDFFVDAKFLDNLSSINFFDLHPNTIAALEDYVAHKNWLGRRIDEEISQLSLLFRLLIEQTLVLAKLVESAGGSPLGLETSNDNSGKRIFDMIIHVQSSARSDATLNKILSTLLQPSAISIKRIFQLGREFTITIHSAYGRLFFFAYHSGSADILVMAKLRWNEVDSVLGLSDAFQGKKCAAPPISRNELLDKLSSSLLLRKRTICNEEIFTLEWRKPSTLLLHEPRRISGYLTTITVSLVRRSLLFEVYLCNNTSNTTIKVALSSLCNLLNSEYEYDCLKKADVKHLVHLVSDRLILLPSTRSYVRMGLNGQIGARRRLHQSSQNYMIRKGSNYCIKTKASPGRHIFTCVHRLAGVKVLIDVREFRHSRDLIIFAYAVDSHISINACLITAKERGVFFNPNIKWQNVLLARLCTRLDNINSPYDKKLSLEFDRSVYKSIAHIGNRTFFFNVIANVKECYIGIYLEDPHRKDRYEIIVTNEYMDNMKYTMIAKIKDLAKEILGIVEYIEGEGLILRKSYCKNTVRIKKLIQVKSTTSIKAKPRTKPVLTRHSVDTTIMLKRAKISHLVFTDDSKKIELDDRLNIRLYNNIKAAEERHIDAETHQWEQKECMKEGNSQPEKEGLSILNESMCIPYKLQNLITEVGQLQNYNLEISGDKILRKVLRVDESILYISVFVMKSVISSLNLFPYSFRVVGFDRSSGHKLKLLVSSEAAGEVLGSAGKYSYDEVQYRLADDLCRRLILIPPAKESMKPKLFIEWSGAKLNYPVKCSLKISLNQGNTILKGDDLTFQRRHITDLYYRGAFNLPIRGASHASYNCIVSLRHSTSKGIRKNDHEIDSLIFGIYVPTLSMSCEVDMSSVFRDDKLENKFYYLWPDIQKMGGIYCVLKSNERHKKDLVAIVISNLLQQIQLNLDLISCDDSSRHRLWAEIKSVSNPSWYSSYMQISNTKKL